MRNVFLGLVRRIKLLLVFEEVFGERFVREGLGGVVLRFLGLGEG